MTFNFFMDIPYLVGGGHCLRHVAIDHIGDMVEGPPRTAHGVITHHRMLVDTGGHPGVGHLQQQCTTRAKTGRQCQSGHFPHHGIRAVQSFAGVRHLVAVHLGQLTAEIHFVDPARQRCAAIAGDQLVDHIVSTDRFLSRRERLFANSLLTGIGQKTGIPPCEFERQRLVFTVEPDIGRQSIPSLQRHVFTVIDLPASLVDLIDFIDVFLVKRGVLACRQASQPIGELVGTDGTMKMLRH